MLFMSFLSEIGASIIEGLRTLCAYVSAIIYDFIVVLYNLFIYLSRVEILDNEFIQSIYSKVGSLLILFMIFKLIFSLINSLIEPDKFNDKKNGFVSIVKRSIISIVLLGITPFIFKELFAFQTLIIGADDSNDNILYKLVLGDAIVSDTSSMGQTLSSNLFFSFYTDYNNPQLGGLIDTPVGEWKSENIDYIKEKVRGTENEPGTFLDAVDYVTLTGPTGEYYIEFNIVFSIFVGVFVAYILIVYCIQVAVRVFQLAYLQLVAPVPILSYISEPEGTFKKWINQCITTYLDLFIRLLIIYFVIYFCDYINKNIDNIVQFDLGLEVGTMTYIWIYIFLIIGLLLFAKKLPELLKELFPSKSGVGKLSFGLNPKKNLMEPLKPFTEPIGLITRKTIRGIDSARTGHGFSQGWKSEQGKIESWFNKQREKYTPYSYEQIKNKNAGHKEVKEIDVKWNDGVKIAKKLMDKGFGAAGTANGWDKVLDGITRDNYNAIFKHNEFVKSKMDLDKAKNDLNILRDGLLQVQSGGIFTYGGVTYTSTNVSDLSKKYNSQSGTVSGLESVHGSIRKQYADDAKTEDTFKFIKSNNTNPADPSNTHTSKHI